METLTEGQVARIEALARPEHFDVYIEPRAPVWMGLGAGETLRLQRKLEMVKRSAARLAANMLKGVLKYDSDDLSVEEWLAHLKDDLTDSLNYSELLTEQWKVEKL